MMDLKEIIRWFIPCFHIFLVFLKTKMDFRVTVVFSILLFSFCSSCVEAKVNSAKLNVTKELGLGLSSFNSNVSFVSSDQFNSTEDTSSSLEKSTNGRTFGRPFKKMAAALIPLVFQLGAASTWALVAALLGAKTLLVTLAILKILLLVGAAKFGALFASHKPVHHEHHQDWDPKKEIHLHIHNGHHETHEEHISASPWSRGGEASPVDSKYKVVVEPYGGPQTISTPFGNYVKIDTGPAATT